MLLCVKDMSRSSRTSVSNWDTKDTEHGIRRRKPGESFTYSKSQARERSPQLAGGSDSECHGVESSAKADRKFPDALLARNRERSCSAKMSPGLEDWRQQYQSHSPRTGWGRSYRYYLYILLNMPDNFSNDVELVMSLVIP